MMMSMEEGKRERKYGLKEEKQRRNGKRGGSDDSV